jgi:organic radical activating enzyme
MHCGYCDETEKMQPGRYRETGLAELLGRVEALEAAEPGHRAVSLTGGEPLFYAGFLRVFLPELKTRGFRTYLETNGTLARELESVIADVDTVAMDMKPPSSTGDRDFWAAHRRFLEAARLKEVFVKIVVTPRTVPAEIAEAVRIIAETDPAVPLVFQPETEPSGAISLEALRRIRLECVPAAAVLRDVRVIPQMHKIWGVR